MRLSFCAWSCYNTTNWVLVCLSMQTSAIDENEQEEMERNMKVTFDVKLTSNDVFRFNIYQAYRGMQGIISVLLPAIIIGAVIKNYSEFGLANALLYLAIAIVLFAYVPVSLWFRSKKVLKTNEVLANTLHFEFEEETICVSQDDQKAEFKWENVYKLVATKKLVLLYTNRLNAYIIPREQIKDAYADLATLAKSQLERSRIHMR